MLNFARTLTLTLSGSLLIAATASAQQPIVGAGASFPAPIYSQWAAQYFAATKQQVNYQSIGSGGGQKQIIARTVDFGASDDPMSADKLAENGLVQFPTVIGGIVPVVNIPGVAPGKLKLNAALISKIYRGVITKWNDPAITALNADLKLPALDIAPVYRSDSSGTTFGWTNYLSKADAEWKQSLGEGKAVKWTHGQGAKGNEGVAGIVKQMPGSIGYVEYAFAKQNGLSHTLLTNAAGKMVAPSEKSFAAAAANAEWEKTPGMGVILTWQAGEQSWPVTSATFILIPQKPADLARAKSTLAFFDWAFKNGQASAQKLDYVMLPPAVIAKIQQQWATQWGVKF